MMRTPRKGTEALEEQENGCLLPFHKVDTLILFGMWYSCHAGKKVTLFSFSASSAVWSFLILEAAFISRVIRHRHKISRLRITLRKQAGDAECISLGPEWCFMARNRCQGHDFLSSVLSMWSQADEETSLPCCKKSVCAACGEGNSFTKSLPESPFGRRTQWLVCELWAWWTFKATSLSLFTALDASPLKVFYFRESGIAEPDGLHLVLGGTSGSL